MMEKWNNGQHLRLKRFFHYFTIPLFQAIYMLDELPILSLLQKGIG
jgi:hypothetical protein